MNPNLNGATVLAAGPRGASGGFSPTSVPPASETPPDTAQDPLRSPPGSVQLSPEASPNGEPDEAELERRRRGDAQPQRVPLDVIEPKRWKSSSCADEKNLQTRVVGRFS